MYLKERNLNQFRKRDNRIQKYNKKTVIESNQSLLEVESKSPFLNCRTVAWLILCILLTFWIIFRPEKLVVLLIIFLKNSSKSYKCPKLKKKAMNDKGDNFKDYLDNKVDKNFREKSYDGWRLSFNQFKKSLYMFKKEVFVANLKSGDSLYESACGVGLNLIMTLEILEKYNISNIQVYGNDYLSKSVEIANYMLENEAPLGTKKRSICQGDSMDLKFVPSSSFDLVFTGYIDPLVDPLNLSFQKNSTIKDLFAMDDKNCNSSGKINHFAKQAQLKQEDWFASWVTEMVRIVKPGKIVAIESIAKPLCQMPTDRGGVSQHWWKEAVEKYSWDVSIDSIQIHNIYNIPEKGRYCVSMRKN